MPRHNGHFLMGDCSAFAHFPLPRIDTSKLAQIPDAELADSNAKVRAASENRR